MVERVFVNEELRILKCLVFQFVSSTILEPGLRGEEFDLDFETAKKLVRVLRLTAGETFVAFDGLGGEWDCVLTHVESERKNFQSTSDDFGGARK